MESIVEFIAGFADKYPVISTIFMIMGALRVVLKPLFAVAQSYVLYTETKSDDAALKKVEESKIWKGILFILDYVASIKVPPKK